MSRPRKKNKSIEELVEKRDQLESLKKILVTIYASPSIEDLNIVIRKKLPSLCQVDSIELSSQEQNYKKSKYTYSYAFKYKEENHFIFFYKTTGIKSTEKWLLKKVGQALEFYIIRMVKQEELKIDKEQWELAFDTIATPICLTDLKGNILRTNKTFREKTKMSKADLLQKNYFYIFFGRKDNTNHSQSGKGKRRETLSDEGKEYIFEISCQKILQNTENEIQLVILRDITEQTEIENKIAQSAKAAELGIIASSIAHELNNPIAGIQALLQTLQMEQSDEALNEDIEEMSIAIQRCGHIINRLLNIHL